MRNLRVPKLRRSEEALAADELYDRAMWLLLGGKGHAPEPENALACLSAAVKQGSGVGAARLAVLAGLGLGRRQSWSDCLDLLETSATLGHRPAQRQLGVLTADLHLAARIRSSRVASAAIWRRAREGVDIAAWIRSPPAKVASISPRIDVIERFLPVEACRWLICRGGNGMETAMINDPTTGAARPDTMRTNRVTRFGIASTDVVMLFVQARIASQIGFPVFNMEAPNVLSYSPGQEFRPHYDFFNPASPQFAAEIGSFGQRVATFLVYLNEDFSGGETDFPRVRQRYRGRAGDGLVFMNVRPNGSTDLESLHAGLPPTRGRKWLLSQWVRNRPQAIS